MSKNSIRKGKVAVEFHMADSKNRGLLTSYKTGTQNQRPLHYI